MKFKGLRKFFAHNMGPKLLSVLIAFVLWTVVIGSRTVEVDKKVPIEIITAPNMTIANDPPKEVSFRLSGPKTFLRVVLDRREEPIKVDLTNQKSGLVTYRFFSDSIHVPIGVKVLSNSPGAILIKLEELIYKKLPVVIQTAGEPPENFEIVSTTVEPSEVTVKGPKSRIERLKKVSTLPIDLSGLNQNYEKEAVLDLIRHRMELDEKPPKVKIEVKELAGSYRISNVLVEVKTKRKYRLSQDRVTVFVRASPAQLQGLDQTKVKALLEIPKQRKGKYRTKVQVQLPEQVELVRVDPPELEIAID